MHNIDNDKLEYDIVVDTCILLCLLQKMSNYVLHTLLIAHFLTCKIEVYLELLDHGKRRKIFYSIMYVAQT